MCNLFRTLKKAPESKVSPPTDHPIDGHSHLHTVTCTQQTMEAGNPFLKISTITNTYKLLNIVYDPLFISKNCRFESSFGIGDSQKIEKMLINTKRRFWLSTLSFINRQKRYWPDFTMVGGAIPTAMGCLHRTCPSPPRPRPVPICTTPVHVVLLFFQSKIQ